MFTDLLRKCKVKYPPPEVIAEYCSYGNLENLDEVKRRLAKFGVAPNTREMAIEIWSSRLGVPVPTEVKERVVSAAQKKIGEVTGKEAKFH